MKTIISQFLILGDILEVKLHKEGHINDTYYIKTDQDMTYVLQRINHDVFENVDQLMMNIKKITTYLSNYHVQNGDQHYQVLELIDAKDKKTYVIHEKNYYRMYKMIENAVTYQEVPHIDYMEKTGVVLGQFQLMLEAFNSSELHETIPGFHDTVKRYNDLEKAIKLTTKDRYQLAINLIEALRKRIEYTHQITDAIKRYEIPIRVTHNDTKLNNILFDQQTGNPICLIDFDTVMPGSALYDFGDAIRFSCNTAKEDEPNLAVVGFNLPYFKAFSKGYMQTVSHVLTTKEKELLALSPLVITYELTMRFLEDYLNHDRYFKIEYPTHNLIRAKNQFALLCAMEENYEKMKAVIIDYNA